MKKLIILFFTLGIFGNTFASGNSLSIPMSIFGNIDYENSLSGATLNIYNNDNILLNSQKLSGNNYGSNNAFELDKRINLNKFEGTLKYEILFGNNRYTNIDIINSGDYGCSEDFDFQTNKLCRYDIDLSNANKSQMVVLPKVTNTYISNRKDNSFSLFWDSVNLIDGYIIINKNNNSTTRQTNNNIDFTNLLPDTNYNIEIFTYKGDIISSAKEITIKTSTSPVQSSGGKVEADSENIEDFKTNNEIRIVQTNRDEAKTSFTQINSLDTNDDTNITISRVPVVVDNTASMQERVVFLPENTQDKVVFSIPKGVKSNNNATIFLPKVIEKREDIKSMIDTTSLKVEVKSAMQVPTSGSITFDGDIEICMPANGRSNIGKLVIYYSTNGTSWQKDTNARLLKIVNEKICFKTNHLTSFAGIEETFISIGVNPSIPSSGGGGGGGGGSFVPVCNNTHLECKIYNGNYVWQRKIGLSCDGGDLMKTCEIELNNKEDVVTENIIKESSYNTEKNIDKFEFKTPRFKSISENIDKIFIDIGNSFYGSSLNIYKNDFNKYYYELLFNIYLLEDATLEKNEKSIKEIQNKLKQNIAKISELMNNNNKLIKDIGDIKKVTIKNTKVEKLILKTDNKSIFIIQNQIDKIIDRSLNNVSDIKGLYTTRNDLIFFINEFIKKPINERKKYNNDLIKIFNDFNNLLK